MACHFDATLPKTTLKYHITNKISCLIDQPQYNNTCSWFLLNSIVAPYWLLLKETGSLVSLRAGHQQINQLWRLFCLPYSTTWRNIFSFQQVRFNRGRVKGVYTPFPPWDDMQLSNITGILQNKKSVMHSWVVHPLVRRILDPPRVCVSPAAVSMHVVGNKLWCSSENT